jgi:type I restriction enzyme S subunit
MTTSILKLSEVAKIKHGFAFEGEFFSSDEKEHVLLTPGNFHIDQKLYFGSNTKYYDGPIPKDYVLNNGDLLVVMTDLTKNMAILGNAVILDATKKVLHNQRIGKVDFHKDKVDGDFLCLALNSPLVRNKVKASASGTTVRHTSPSKILDVSFSFPPLPEQRKIAKILSTWDKAIATTEKLIETSKQQKKALMQQLLTGKKRLVNPETGKAFEGEWEEVKLGQITEFIKDGTHGTHKRYETGVPMLSAANITKNHKICFEGAPFISEVDYQKIHSKYDISVGDILLTVVGTLGRVAIVEKKERFTLQRSVAIIRVSDGVDNRFLMQLFSSNDFNHLLVRKSNSTAQAGVYLGELAKIKILLPVIEEQQKISSVLVNADQEIEVLETKLAHFKQEKKALMQQLLTGKRRVKVDEVA